MAHSPDHFYEYSTGMIVCGECLDNDLARTASGEFTGDERVYQGMFRRLRDDAVEPYQCDGCLAQNAPYELLGHDD